MQTAVGYEWVYMVQVFMLYYRSCLKYVIIFFTGGKYTGEMKVKECTHLIINKPKGNSTAVNSVSTEPHIKQDSWINTVLQWNLS